MAVESATFINQLNASYPAAGDPKSEGDDHLRLLKAVLQATFPNLSAAAITATTNDLNALAGGATTGANLRVANQATTDNSTKAANTAFVLAAIAAASFSTNLPSQSGNAGKVITTDGVTASWGSIAGNDLYLAANFGAL